MVRGATPALGVAVTARFVLLAGSGVTLSVGLWVLAARIRGRGAVLCLGNRGRVVRAKTNRRGQ